MSGHRVDPHPDKWLSAPKSKSSTQRPLVGSQFRAHTGIATPATTRKGATSPAPTTLGSSSRKRRAPEVTPTAPPAGTRSIQSYLTPPTTSSQPAKKKRASSRLKDVEHSHASPTRRSPRLNRDSTETVSAWRASLPPSVASPIKRPRQDASPSRSPSVQAIEPPATPDAGAPPTSAPALTPIPASAVARRQRLDGPDCERRRATTSPWRQGQGTEDDDEAVCGERTVVRKEAEEQRNGERKRKRLRLDDRKAVDANAQSRASETRPKRALGGFKSLAHLSSDRSSSPRSSSPSERAPLAPKSANALRRHSSAVVEPVCPRDSKWPERQPMTRLPAIPSAYPSRSQIIPSAFPSRQRMTQYQPSQESQPSSSAKPPVISSTPRARRIAHHQVTPPKSRTPQRRDQQETLFEFPPAPPRQPVFKPVSPKPISDWRPVEMEAETLMTWSMGGGNARSVGEPAPESLSPIREGGEGGGSDEPIQADEDDEITCIPGTIPSQYFPNLIASSSSPVRPPRDSASTPSQITNRSDAAVHRVLSDSPESVLVSAREPSSPSPRRSLPAAANLSSPPPSFYLRISPPSIKSPTKPLTRYSKQDPKQRRRNLDHALFSSLSEVSQTRPASRVPSFPRPTQNRKTPPPSKSQSKLEAFGISRSRTREAREFETSFSDEEDLDFEVDFDEHGSSPVAGPSELKSVPSAPPHPSLRLPGIREQEKRQKAAMERHRAQRESQRSSNDGSSSLPPPPSVITYGDGSSSQSDERLDMTESARAWWDGLGETLDE